MAALEGVSTEDIRGFEVNCGGADPTTSDIRRRRQLMAVYEWRVSFTVQSEASSIVDDDGSSAAVVSNATSFSSLEALATSVQSNLQENLESELAASGLVVDAISVAVVNPVTRGGPTGAPSSTESATTLPTPVPQPDESKTKESEALLVTAASFGVLLFFAVLGSCVLALALLFAVVGWRRRRIIKSEADHAGKGAEILLETTDIYPSAYPSREKLNDALAASEHHNPAAEAYTSDGRPVLTRLRGASLTLSLSQSASLEAHKQNQQGKVSSSKALQHKMPSPFAFTDTRSPSSARDLEAFVQEGGARRGSRHSAPSKTRRPSLMQESQGEHVQRVQKARARREFIDKYGLNAWDAKLAEEAEVVAEGTQANELGTEL